jgi:hypothetical protein
MVSITNGGMVKLLFCTDKALMMLGMQFNYVTSTFLRTLSRVKQHLYDRVGGSFGISNSVVVNHCAAPICCCLAADALVFPQEAIDEHWVYINKTMRTTGVSLEKAVNISLPLLFLNCNQRTLEDLKEAIAPYR